MKRQPLCCLLGPQDRRQDFEGEAGDALREQLLVLLRKAHAEGIGQFGCCCGVSFSLLAGEAIMQLKEEMEPGTVQMVLSMPHAPQDTSFWSEEEKARQTEIFYSADHISHCPNEVMPPDQAGAEEYLIRAATHAIVYFSPDRERDLSMLRIIDFFGIPHCNLAQKEERGKSREGTEGSV